MAALGVRKRTVTNLENAKKLNALVSIIAVEIISEFGAAVLNHAVCDDNAVQLVLSVTIPLRPVLCNPRG